MGFHSRFSTPRMYADCWGKNPILFTRLHSLKLESKLGYSKTNKQNRLGSG